LSIADILAHMGVMYAWAAPEYLLDRMSMQQVLLYYEKGIEAQKNNAKVFWGVFGQAMNGEKENKQPEIDMDDSPDLQKFHKLYGNKIKRG
jgi:hypothetical protein